MERKRSSSLEATSTGTSGALYDVFLSFRGPDTRLNFTDTLYYVLEDKGIHVFMDKKEINVGEEIGPEIFQAIDDSRICIPIFSTGYASSRWCLRELEHMMKRRETHELEVKPIFCDVEPEDVKLETRVYRDALTQHKKERGPETVQGWEEALKGVTKIKGWSAKGRGHGEIAREIACEVLVKLEVPRVNISDNLVGMDESVNEVVDLLNVESKDIRLVGICGMGGIGKTTLAKVVYRKLSTKFERHSFISNVRESDILTVQKQVVSDVIGDGGDKLFGIDHGINMIRNRFCRKKILICLDDVDQMSQLKALAAKKEWFGPGSRVVVTTRNKSIFSTFQDQFEYCFIYEVKELNNGVALQLFIKHAFKSNSPSEAFLSLSENVVAKTGGLPLAIEVIGSFLRGRGEAVWQDTLKKMKHCPYKDVKESLMLSFVALEDNQKQIFLDIACFFYGQEKSYAEYMWHDCGYFPEEGIEVLLSLSLVKIDENDRLWMHDQLKDLGRDIVFQENCADPGKRSRVWDYKEANDVIKRKKGSETVSAICLRPTEYSHFLTPKKKHKDYVLTSEDFVKMPNVRYLKLFGEALYGDFEDLLSELRWLSWPCLTGEMQAINFCPKKLVILDMTGSIINEHWGGWAQLKVATRLKVLNLSCCWRLRTTPDLSAYLSLEILILEHCLSLRAIHPSIGHLKCLKHLNLNHCHKLQELPAELGSLEALTELLAISVTNLMTLPDPIGMLQSLDKLDISCTGIVKLPNTIVHLKNLKVLKMNRTCVQKLPDEIGMLEKLEEIYGENCFQLETIPGDIGTLPFVKILKLTKTRIKLVPRLPKSLVSLSLSSTVSSKAPDISNLVSLRNLELHFPLIDISGSFCKLQHPSISSISPYLDCFSCLKELQLRNCESLCRIGQLPPSLRQLRVTNCCLLEVMDLSNLSYFKNLKDLEIGDCPKLIDIQGLDKQESLESLYIKRCSSLLRLPDLSNWKKLKSWDVDAHVTYSARGKQVARSNELARWYEEDMLKQ